MLSFYICILQLTVSLTSQAFDRYFRFARGQFCERCRLATIWLDPIFTHCQQQVIGQAVVVELWCQVGTKGVQRKYSNNICFCGVYIKFLTLPSKCCCRNLDSSDQAIFFSNFGEPVKIVGTVSCAYVTGMAPAAVGYLHESLRCCADHAELLYTLHILCKRFFFKLIILSP